MSSDCSAWRALAVFSGTLALSVSTAHAAAFTPKLGQSGKDVMWLPTPDALVTRLLTMAQLTSADQLVDLGSGDGKIVIAAARDFGAAALGVEFDARLLDVARTAAAREGVADRTRFDQGDIFEVDFSRADVVAMYLLPQLNLKLRPVLLSMKPGTRVVTHWFDMGDWKADETTEVESRPGYLWVVPANAHGTWRLADKAADASTPIEMTFTQRFQKVEGAVALGEVQTSATRPSLLGKQFKFGFTDLQGIRQQVRASIEGDVMQGEIAPALASGVDAAGSAPRLFKARRTAPAGPLPGSEPASDAEIDAAHAALGAD